MFNPSNLSKKTKSQKLLDKNIFYYTALDTCQQSFSWMGKHFSTVDQFEEINSDYNMENILAN